MMKNGNRARIKPLLREFIVPILVGLIVNLITYVIGYLFTKIWGQPFRWQLLVIAIVVGVPTAGLVYWIAPGGFRRRVLAAGLCLFVILAVFAVLMFFMRWPLEKWNFESGTTEGWGLYDEHRGIIEDSDVANTAEFAKGQCSLKVANRDHPGTAGADPWEKLPAVRCQCDFSKAIVSAEVFLPPGANLKYADARFFLFAGEWDWKQSGTLKYGTHLVPGRWVTVSWDLRSVATNNWPKPWPKENILGIKLHVEGGYEGPIYIDNVTIEQ
jgi:hypothetical protein